MILVMSSGSGYARNVLRRRLTATVAAVAAVVALAACGGSSSTPQATLHTLPDRVEPAVTGRDARAGGHPAARRSRTANAGAFSALGVKAATFSAGRVSEKGAKAQARVTAELRPAPRRRMEDRHHRRTSCSATASGRWRGRRPRSTPRCTAPNRLATIEDWPPRAGITGAGGAPLIAAQHLVNVGVVGSRIKDAKEVGADLVAAGATAAEVKPALAQAKAHPTFFEPVFQISQTRFEQLKAQPGAHNVYAVPGTAV